MILLLNFRIDNVVLGDCLMVLKNICVFLSSRMPSEEYSSIVKSAAKVIAKQNHALIYGGAQEGLMGVLAQEYKDCGGCHLVGIMANSIEGREKSFSIVDDYHLVSDLNSRKKLMLDKSDTILLLAGGIGSLDEFFSSLVVHYVGEKRLNIAIYDPSGLYLKLLELLESLTVQGFICNSVLGHIRHIRSEEMLEEYLISL